MRPCPRCRAPLQNRDATCPHCGAAEAPAPLDTRDPAPVQDTPRRIASDSVGFVLFDPLGMLLVLLAAVLIGAIGFAVAGPNGALCAVIGAAVLWFALVMWAESG
jgi:hypothetical protein